LYWVWFVRGRGGRITPFLSLYPLPPPLKIVSIDRIPVSQQEAWSRVFRKRLDHLLRRPGGGWMFSDVEMKDLTSLVQKNDEAVKLTEGRGGDSKEIDADDLPSMIGEESFPRLGGRLKCFDSIFGNC